MPSSRIVSVRLTGLLLVGVATVASAQVPTPRPSAIEPRARARTATATVPVDSFASLQRQLADARARGDLAVAIAVAERQHRLFPNEMKATADLGDVCLARGDAARAEPLLRAAMKQPSRHYTGRVAPVVATIYANLGQIALAKGRPKDAIPSLQLAADYSPGAGRARYILASALAAVGETERGTKELRAAFYDEASAAVPGDYVLLARLHERAGDRISAARAFEAALTRYPLDVDLRLERAALMRGRGRSADALFDLVYARMLAHADDARLTAIATRISELRAETTSARPDPRLRAMFAYLDDAASGRPDDALRSIREVVAVEPEAFVPRLLLARTCADTGRMAEAERTLALLVTEDASSVPALAELAALMYAQGRVDAARPVVERARGLDAGNARLREVLGIWSQ